MAKQTLLELVQNIASVLESDDVNSISDTIESYQIAREVQTAYYELVVNLGLPTKKSLILLNGLSDTTRPNYLSIPSSAQNIQWVKYDTLSNGTGSYKDLMYLSPDDFLLKIVANTTLSAKQTVTDFSGAHLSVLNTVDPTYWTSFDNKYVITDSFNSGVETTLQQSKTLCFGDTYDTFTLSDTFIPALDDNLFPLLLAEAKSACFANIKQVPNAKEEQRARRQLIRAQSHLSKTNHPKGADRLPNYGRVRPGLQTRQG